MMKLLLAIACLTSCSPLFGSTLIVCTVNQECAALLEAFGRPMRIKESEPFARRLFRIRTSRGKSVYVLQPREGGSAQDKMRALLVEAIRWFKKRGHPVQVVVGFGTAGGVSKHYTPGDVVVSRSFEYRKLKGKQHFSKASEKLEFEKKPLPNSTRLFGVPYNSSPKLFEGECITVNRFIKRDEKTRLSAKCFQMNDYVTASVAKTVEVPFFAVRVISDTEKIPEGFRKAQLAYNLWGDVALGKKPRSSCFDCLFYERFRLYFLTNAASVLKKMLNL